MFGANYFGHPYFAQAYPIYGSTYSQECTETVTLTDSLIKASTKLLTETITHTEIFSRTIVRLLSEVITFSDVMVLTANRHLVSILTESLCLKDILWERLVHTITSWNRDDGC